MSADQGSLKSIFYAFGANLGIAVVKSGAAAITGSGSMLAEAVHSFADCGNQGLLFLGHKRARRPPDKEHPLGHGKAIYFWSFIVALMLFSMGGLFSLYEGWHKLSLALSPEGGEALENPWLAVGVLAIGIVLEAASLFGALKESRESRKGKGLWEWLKTSRESTFVVVIYEDLAALFGLILALAAIFLTMITGNVVYDALGSMAVGALLIVIAVIVGGEVKSLLLGVSADEAVEETIRKVVAGHESVEKVLNLITLQMGPQVVVAVKALMKPTGSETSLCENINAIEREIRAACPQAMVVFFEPDLAE
jgi:cation diffusion facilitator family transporter